MQTNFKKYFSIVVFFAVLGFMLGYRFLALTPRSVDTIKVEGCLRAYYAYRHSGDALKLKQELDKLNVKPDEFEKIIDRFIHYRTSKSALDQAMKLLDAFMKGYRIAPENIASSATDSGEYFALDAEILSVFKKNPDLVRRAFEG